VQPESLGRSRRERKRDEGIECVMSAALEKARGGSGVVGDLAARALDGTRHFDDCVSRDELVSLLDSIRRELNRETHQATSLR
jgi:hypothetical protein